MSVAAADLAKRLGAKRSGKGWQARCPAHDDRKASLSMTERYVHLRPDLFPGRDLGTIPLDLGAGGGGSVELG